MLNKNQSGFSLIELLLVVVIIGIIASIGVPSLLKARAAAENSSTYTVMRTISTLQTNFYTRNNRFARLDELNATQGNGLGTVSGAMLTRSPFVFEMTPATPTDEQLKEGYIVTATRVTGASETSVVYTVDQSGVITP